MKLWTKTNEAWMQLNQECFRIIANLHAKLSLYTMKNKSKTWRGIGSAAILAGRCYNLSLFVATKEHQWTLEEKNRIVKIETIALN